MKLLLACLILLLIHVVSLHAEIKAVVKTIAGLGVCDNQQALTSIFKVPTLLAINSLGEVHVIDKGHHRIRKIFTNGTIITIAGTGVSGYNGDGIDARMANLNFPDGIAIDPKNDEVYISDSYNHRIRKILSNGTIVTVAGQGLYGRTGDGGLAIKAKLHNPKGLAFSPNGDLVLCDTGNNVIRNISATTGIITTIAGDFNSGYNGDNIPATSAHLNQPSSCAFTSTGKLIIADTDNYRVRLIELDGKIKTLVTPSGSYYPTCVAVDANDEIYFSDTNRNRILKILSNGTILTVVGTGYSKFNGDYILATNANLYSPYGLLVKPNGELVLSESSRQTIRIVLTNGTIVPFAGIADGTYCKGVTAANTPINLPKGTTFGKDGDIFVVEQQPARVSRITKDGLITDISSDNGVDGSLLVPFGVTSDLEGNAIIADYGNSLIRKILKNGTMVIMAGIKDSPGYNGDGKLATSTSLYCPTSLVVDPKTGELYFADSSNYRIRKILNNGTIITIVGIGVDGFNGDGMNGASTRISVVSGMALGPEGDLYFADNYRIRKLVTNGTVVTIAGNGKSGNSGDYGNALSAKFDLVSSVAVDTNGDVYVADYYSNVVRKILSNGTVVPFAGSSQGQGVNDDGVEPSRFNLNYPYFVSVSSRTGEVLISDTYNNALRMVTTTRQCNETLASDPMVCSGNGFCYTNDVCHCNPGYIGQFCNYLACNNIKASDSQVCNGHGTCQGPNICNCTTGYTGQFCDLAICNGFNTSDSQVCNGHGICTLPDVCNCTAGYSGKFCNELTCNGFNNNDSQVCSGNGICQGPNICNCTTGYTGQFCDLSMCNNLNETDSRVCNGNGNCTGPDLCNCTTGYNGIFCEIVTCNGLNNNDPQVCNGHGDCKGLNNCNCTTGYTGQFCDLAICNGYNTSDSQVCNGHGTCQGPDVCNCTSGYSGIFCEMVTCNGFNNNDPQVCGGHGNCQGPNICNCTNGYTGQFCDLSMCNNLNETDSRVCNGNGNCTGPDVCNCTSGYSGIFCEMVTCNGFNTNDPQVCSGHGNCQGPNTCNCTTGFIGKFCDVTVCGGLFSNDSQVCNGHGICQGPDVCNCTSGYSGIFCETGDGFCDRAINCSGHGECSSNNRSCICYSNSTRGYFTSLNCNSCQSNYFGEVCLTRIEGPLRLNDETNGLLITLIAPSSFESLNVSCSKLIHNSDLKLLGDSPKCYWKQKESGLFMIELGNNFEINIQDHVRFDTSVFDSVSKSQYLTFTIEGPLNPSKPVAIISTRKNAYSLCEDIIIDGSSSYSLDRKQLFYIWSVIQIPKMASLSNSSLQFSTYSNSSIQISFSQTYQEGTYIIRLQVESSLTNVKSDPIDFSFTKVSIIPSLSIEGAVDGKLNVKTLNVPIIIEKKISIPSCYSNISIPITIEWSQTSGESIEYRMNSNNDLVITSFPKKGSFSYTFNVKSIMQDSQTNVSSQVVIQTSSENLSANMYTDTISSKMARFMVEFQDLEQSNEIETWNYICLDENLNTCGQTVSNILSNYGILKSKSLELSLSNFPSVDLSYSLNLNITKGIRSVSSLVTFKFPKENQKLPPLISILNVIPNRNRLSKSEDLSLQLSIINNDGSEIKNLKREWKLNGQSIPNSYLTRMSTLLSESNNIILSMIYLEGGSSNILTCQVTDLDTQLSSTFSYSFSIITSPKPCPCTVSPLIGYALETDFTFSCLNCQNKDNTLAFSLSFVDDKSGATIPLVIEGGNTFTTKLPYPISNPLIFDISIVDTETGASVQNYQNVQMLLPKAISVREVKSKVAKWNTFQSSLQQNDLRRMIFSSAIISRTSEAMIAALSARRRRSSTCLNGGVYNYQLRKCECVNGYKKKDCSVSEEDFQLLREFKGELFNNFLFAFKNQQKQMSEMYIIYQFYGLDSLLSNYDELSDDMFSNGIQMFKNLISSATTVSNLHLRPGVDKLSQNIVNSIYKYLVYNGCVTNECLKEHIIEMTTILNEVSKLLLRSKLVGEADLKLETDFMTLFTNKNYRYHYNNMKVLNVTLPINDEGLSLINNRMLISFILTSTQNLVNKIESTVKVTESVLNNRKEIETITTDYSISSKVFKFTFLKDISMNRSISYSFPRNEQFVRNVQETFEYSCISIVNITQIEREHNCQVIIDQDVITCQCPYQNETQIGVLKSVISKSVQQINLPSNSDSNNLLYLLFLLMLILIISCIVIIGIIVILCFVKRRRNKKATKEAPSVEMGSVTTSTV